MERTTDWAALWRQIVEAQRHSRSRGSGSPSDDPWKSRARDFAARARRKRERPDPVREFLTARVDENTTVLDVGAGTGSWAVPLARRARRVTALDPSPSMLAVLREELVAEGIGSVEVVEGSWPDCPVEPHDVTLCAHAMYSSPDLPSFVRRMVEVTRRTCYLLMRVPTPDGVMAEAARRVWGQPYDSPNFVVAYNVLLEMGLRPNVLVDPSPWSPWTSPSLEAALADVKERLGLGERSEHDDYLRDLLARRLTEREGELVWPSGTHSALAYWDVSRPS